MFNTISNIELFTHNNKEKVTALNVTDKVIRMPEKGLIQRNEVNVRKNGTN